MKTSLEALKQAAIAFAQEHKLSQCNLEIRVQRHTDEEAVHIVSHEFRKIRSGGKKVVIRITSELDPETHEFTSTIPAIPNNKKITKRSTV